MADPLISVVVPTFNQSDYLEQAIESILNQTYSNIEVLVVNDGSTDNTPQILSKYTCNPTIKVLTQDNQGLAAARNAGIREARGAYIALLDSDDLMEPNRLEIQHNEMLANPAIDILYTAVLLIDEQGKPIKIIRREAIEPINFLPMEFFRNQVPSPSTLLIKKEVFRKELFNPDYTLSEDLEWILRAAHTFIFSYLDLPLTKYRRHAKNLSEDVHKLQLVERRILCHYNKEHIKEYIKKSTITDKPLWFGKILYLMGDYEEAIKILYKSKDPLAYFYLGNCYFELQKYQTAIELYKKSIALDNNYPEVHNNLGVTQLKVGENGNQDFAVAKELNSDYHDPHHRCFTRRELRKDLLPYRSIHVPEIT